MGEQTKNKRFITTEKIIMGKPLITLTFRDNEFHLIREVPDKPYITTKNYLDLKDAYKFREFADERAERVFSRCLVKFYGDGRDINYNLLDKHQNDGVNWILSRSRSYLAHAPGAGKTAQAIIAAQIVLQTLPPLHNKKALFIVPPSLSTNWVREMHKFLTPRPQESDTAVVPLSQNKEEMNWDATFIICPDSMLTKSWVLRRLLSLDFCFVAVDEASRFKEASSERTKALFGGQLKKGRSPGLIQKASWAVLLDGSPMPNRPLELWAPVYAMAPETIDFMEREEFGMRYCGPTMNGFGQMEFKFSSHEKELREKLTKTFMHVVSESELEHPERRRSFLYINKELRSMKQRQLETSKFSYKSFEGTNETHSNGELASYRKEIGLLKVKWVANYIRSRLITNRQEQLLLFAWHIEVIERLANVLRDFTPGVVVGSTPKIEREDIFKRYQNGGCQLIIGNIAAMGRGHNLQNTDRIVFAEYAWSNETNVQAEKRASRRGSNREFVRCEYVVMPGSIDEAILRAVMRGQSRVKKIIGE